MKTFTTFIQESNEIDEFFRSKNRDPFHVMDKDAHKFFDPNPYIEKMNTYFNDKFEFDRQEVLNGKIYYMFRSKKQKIMIDRTMT